MITAYRISIFDPKFANVLARNVANEITTAQHEMVQGGCGAAAFTTSLTWSQAFARGYYKGRNGVEVSRADDWLQHPISTAFPGGKTAAELAGGAFARIYVSDTRPYDQAVTGSTARLFVDDGATLTMGLDAVAVGTDSTGPYVSVKAPAAMPGNPSSLSTAYAVGPTMVGRRCWAGRIARRDRRNARGAMMSFACTGIGKRLEERQATVNFNAIEIGSAIWTTINLFNTASGFADLVLSAANFPSTGQTYSGSRTGTKVSDCIVEMLAANSTGDLWVVRVGHDRTPRLLKLYDAATNTYTRTVTLAQSAAVIRATNVQSSDEDTSGMWNSVLVTGDTNSSTNQQAAAFSQDAVSIATNLQIDAPTVTNTALKTNSACAALGQALLNQQAIPTATNALDIFVKSDSLAPGNSPSGLASGEVVYGIECIQLGGFDSKGEGPNRLPDSDLLLATGVGALWTPTGTPTVTATGPGGAYAMGLASADAFDSPPFDFAPGQQITLSGWLDTSPVTVGQPVIQLRDAAGVTQVTWNLPAAVAGLRRAFTAIIPPGAAVGHFTLHAAGNGATIGGAGRISLSQLMVQLGPINIGYVANQSAPAIFGLPTSIVTNAVGPAGPLTQTVRFKAVEPDWNADMRERTNALVNAILANTQSGVSIDQYTLSTDAYPTGGIPTSGLNVLVPAFAGIFAKNTPLQVLGSVVVALPAGKTSWVWVSSGNAWTVKQDSSSVPGGICYATFTTTASSVAGQRPMTTPGVVKIGVGNVNVGAHPTPTGTSSLAQGSTNNLVHSQVVAAVALTNVPTDDTVSALIFAYRIHGSADPLSVVDGVPLARGVAAQSVSLGFAIGAGQNIDVFCAYAGIASADYGPGWAQIGNATQVANGFVAQPLVVTVPYMIGSGVAAAPTCPVVTGPPALPSFTPAASVNGLSGSFVIAWKITNHPQDGSCRRIAIYRRIYNASTPAAYEWYASMPVANAPNPPLSVTYGIQPADLTNGQQYDWACCFENAQGAESPLGFIGTSPVVKIDLGSSAFKSMPAAVRASGPNVTAAALGAPLTGGGVASQPFTVTFGDWTNPTPPDWGAGIYVVLRKNGTHEPIGDPTGYAFPANPAGVSFTAQIPAGVTVDIGFYYHDTANSDSFVWWPPASGAGSALNAVVGGAINPGQSVAGTGKINYVADSSYAYKLAHWKSAGTPAMTTYPKNNANTGNPEPFAGSPGANTNCTGALYNQPFTPVPGAQYTESCFVGWLHTGGGAATMFVAICDVSDWNANSGAGNATPATLYTAPRAIPVGGGTDVTDVHWTCPASGAPAQVCFVWYWTNANYPFSMAKAMIEAGPQWTGYVPGAATTDTGAGGTQARAVAHTDFQLTAQPGGGINVASPLHSNKNLDNVPAGATYGAVNTAYRATDPSGRIAPVIDFAMSGNANKTQDNVAAGASYGRTSLAYLYVDGSAQSAPLINFTSSSHLNKTLDAINDGTAYGRTNLAYLYTDVSSRRAPLIDFSNAAHISKQLDSIADGSTYGRPLLARLSSGKPFIDFSEAFNVNKNVDYLSNGSSYGRPLLTRLSSGKPFIDFSEAVNLNKIQDNVADGSTYGRAVLTRLSAGKPFVDFSESFNLNKTLDNVADGATYGRYSGAYRYTDGLSRLAPLLDFSSTAHQGKNVDNINDGATYGRPVLSRLSSGKPFVDLSESVNLNRTQDNIADGSTYGRTNLAYLYADGSGLRAPAIDFSASQHAFKNLDNISDGGTYGRVNVGYLYTDGSSRRAPAIDFAAGAHAHKTLDYMPAGSTFGSLSTAAGVGTNAVDNGNFVLQAGPTETGQVASRWTAAQLDAGLSQNWSAGTFGVNVSPSTVMGASSSLNAAIANGASGAPFTFACVPGETYVIGGLADVYLASGLLATGVTFAAYVRLLYFDVTGAYLGGSNTNLLATLNTGFVNFTPAAIVAPASSAYGRVDLVFSITNTNSASVTLPAATFGGYFQNIFCRKASNYDTEIIEGSVYSRVGAGYVYTDGSAHRAPAIDFSASQHIYKNSDYLADGATYVRTLGSRVSSGKPFIDFSEAINLNKTLDQVADGTTYGRTNLYYLSADFSGRRQPIIDVSASHYYKTQDYIGDGSTYGRTNLAYLYTDGSSRRAPAIDFTATQHAFKNIDNVSDGSIYGRTNLYYLSADFSGRRQPIIDVSAAHYYKTLDYISDGATYGRTNLVYLYTDGSGRRAPAIDLSSTYHTNRDLRYVKDAPSNTLDPANTASGLTLSGSNLIATHTAAAGFLNARSLYAMSQGKWYWEVTTNANNCLLGIATSAMGIGANYPGNDAGSYGYYSANGYLYHAAVGAAYGAAFSGTHTVGVALDMDNLTLTFYLDGVSQGTTGIAGGTYYPAIGIYENASVTTANFGGTKFMYLPPAGFVGTRYAAAEANANNTESRTSNNTNNVGTVPATAVQSTIASGGGLKDSAQISKQGVYNSVAYTTDMQFEFVSAATGAHAGSFYIHNGTRGSAPGVYLPSDPTHPITLTAIGSVTLPAPLDVTATTDTIYAMASYVPGSTSGSVRTYASNVLQNTTARSDGWFVIAQKNADFSPALKALMYADGYAQVFTTAAGGGFQGGGVTNPPHSGGGYTK